MTRGEAEPSCAGLTKKLTPKRTAPAPATMKAAVEIVAVVWAESMSPQVEGGQRSLTHPLLAELVDASDIKPVTNPVTTPAPASPTPPHRIHIAAGESDEG